MARRLRVGLVGALMAALWVGGARPIPAAAAGSFLKRPVASAAQLVAQVEKDPALQKRYARHLGIEWQAVAAHLRGRLRPDVIRKAGFFTVYNITATGEIYPTKQRLPAGTRIYRLGGTPVFFTRMGDPARPFFRPVVVREEPARPAAPQEPRVEVILIHTPTE